MRYLVSIMSIIFSTLLVSGQDDTLIHIQPLELEEESEIQCDSIIDIFINGNIDCKLIFEQLEYDISNNNLIVIPHTKIDSNDNSVLYSEHRELAKTILKLDYDTCFVRNFKKRDNNRNFKLFTTPPDTSKIKDWKVDIQFQQSGCMDTDYKSVRISKNKSDFIKFSCARSIQIFELDLNNDTTNEIYLISYVWCASEIKIYRIDIK